MPPIVLFTDYGFAGPYVGQVHAAIHAVAPGVKVIDLMHDAPAHNPRASAYLLAAFTAGLPAGTVIFSVVDPGVGTETDPPVAFDLDGRIFVGPDNGLFDIAARRAQSVKCRRIRWRPAKLSNTFHGRDLYAPVCAMLAAGRDPGLESYDRQDPRGWPDDLAEVIYVDRFGNCMTGIRSEGLDAAAGLEAAGVRLSHAGTFARVPQGEAFWYGNSIGLVELAVNGGSAVERLRLRIGEPVRR